MHGSVREEIMTDSKDLTTYINSAEKKEDLGDYQGAISDYSEATKIGEFLLEKEERNIPAVVFSDETVDYFLEKIVDSETKEMLLKKVVKRALMMDLLKKKDSQKHISRLLNSYLSAQAVWGIEKDWELKYNNKPNFLISYTKYHLKDIYLKLGKLKTKVNDIEGACEDWKSAEGIGSEAATDLLKKYCTNNQIRG
tara:strand:- start:98 stop:685 length:588 start_codon:yes stop_codon:yes gene_type:complete